MTSNEMRNSFVLQYEKINANDAPGLQDTEISILLTKAQQELAYKLIRRVTNSVREGLEETELRKQGLANLVKDSEDTSSTGTTLLAASAANYPNGRFWQMPDDFWFAIGEEAWINQPDCTSTAATQPDLQAYVKVVTHNEVQNNIDNPYRRPFFQGDRCYVWRLEYERVISGYDMTSATVQNITPPVHEILTDGTFSVNRYKVRYIRYPKPIVVDRTTPINQKNSELNPMLHEALVEEAVRLASISLRDPMPQGQTNMVNLQ